MYNRSQTTLETGMKGVEMIEVYENLGIDIDAEKANSWYLELKENFKDSRWRYVDFPEDAHAPEGSTYSPEGYSIRVNHKVENYKSPNFSKHGNVFEDTPMMFGWVRDVAKLFTKAKSMWVVIENPGAHLPLHSETTHDFKVHIPLTYHTGVFFFDENDNNYPCDIGNAYMLQHQYPHGFWHVGEGERAMLMLKYDQKDLEEIYSLRGSSV